MAVADHEVTIGQFLHSGDPGQLDAGQFPLRKDHDFTSRVDFQHVVAAPIANQGMPVAHAWHHKPRLRSRISRRLCIPVIFPDGMIRLMAYQIVPIVQLTRHAVRDVDQDDPP